MSNIAIFKSNQTPQYLESVNEPDYCTEVPPNKFVAQDYALPGVLINPDISAVKDVPLKYWKQVSLTVIEMSVAEKKMVDDAEKAKSDIELETLNSLSAKELTEVLVSKGLITKKEITDSLKEG